MSAIENNRKKYQGILDAITQIQMREVSIGYDFTKWEITFDENPRDVDYIKYSRVHVFNTKVDILVTKRLFLKIKNLSDSEENELITNLSGYIILKYPFSAIPQTF